MHLAVATRTGAHVSTAIQVIEHEERTIIIMEPVDRLSAERIGRESEWICPQVADSLRIPWVKARFVLRTPLRRADDRFTAFHFDPLLTGAGPFAAGVATLASDPGPLDPALTRTLQRRGDYTFTKYLDTLCVFRSALLRSATVRVHAYDGERYYRKDGQAIRGTLDRPAQRSTEIHRTKRSTRSRKSS